LKNNKKNNGVRSLLGKKIAKRKMGMIDNKVTLKKVGRGE